MAITTFSDYLSSLGTSKTIRDLLGEDPTLRTWKLLNLYVDFLLKQHVAQAPANQRIQPMLVPLTTLLEQCAIINAYIIKQVNVAERKLSDVLPMIDANLDVAPIQPFNLYEDFNQFLIKSMSFEVRKRYFLGSFNTPLRIGAAAVVTLAFAAFAVWGLAQVAKHVGIALILVGPMYLGMMFAVALGVVAAGVVLSTRKWKGLDPLTTTVSKQALTAEDTEPSLLTTPIKHQNKVLGTTIDDEKIFLAKKQAMNIKLDDALNHFFSTTHALQGDPMRMLATKNALFNHYNNNVYTSFKDYQANKGLLNPVMVTEHEGEIPCSPAYSDAEAIVNLTTLSTRMKRVF